MFSNKCSGIARVGRATTVVATLAIVALSQANAETVMSFNGKSLDSALLDAYITGRIQKPAAEATEQDRAAITKELEDVFLLSTIELAAELEKDPAVAAQIELQRIGTLARAVVGKLAQEIEVSDEEVVAVYEEQIKLAPGTQYKASHILVQSQGEAVAIIQELIGGADFAELAKERSSGPSAPKGGELPWFSPDQMVPQFTAAVARLEDGRYTTDPVQSEFGWHVILRQGTRPAEPPPLESARENIVAKVRSDKLRAKITELRLAASE